MEHLRKLHSLCLFHHSSLMLSDFMLFLLFYRTFPSFKQSSMFQMRCTALGYAHSPIAVQPLIHRNLIYTMPKLKPTSNSTNTKMFLNVGKDEENKDVTKAA